MNEHFIDIAEKKNVAFYAYRLPKEINIEYGADFMANNGFHNGFVIGDFSPCNVRTIGKNLTLEQLVELPDMDLDDKSVPLSTNKDEYLKGIDNIISKIKESNLGKVVISKVITMKRYKILSSLFEALCQAYPKAFIYCFHTIETGTWIGATPEVLVKCKDGKGETMALAGTRPVNTEDDWDNKNIQEQRMVVDFIKDKLESENLMPHVGSTLTLKAGPVEHICTPLNFTITPESDIEKFITELSPTPAVSGFPRLQAVELIRDTEFHSRICYGGFCGLYNIKDDIQLFVNLRCMQVFKNWITLYVGGGITKDSNPLSEWSETEIKAKTLLNII